jgi:hypothetical protein
MVHIRRFIKHFKGELFPFLIECQPVQFWILSRHGTRYSGADDISNMWSLLSLRDEIISNLENGRKYCHDIVLPKADISLQPSEVRTKNSEALRYTGSGLNVQYMVVYIVVMP